MKSLQFPLLTRSGLFRLVAALLVIGLVPTGCASVPAFGNDPPVSLTMPEHRLEWIGHQVYRNECAARRACLVHWNPGEAFPSLGIGHFIWYPAGVTGPFTESFPALVEFLEAQGAGLPRWLPEQAGQGAPWPNREAFLAAEESGDPRVSELRHLLDREKALQAAFLVDRARGALSQVAAAARNPAEVRRKISLLAETPGGVYALIDYVNFKGEGLATSERYQGVGWGLLQVLETMAVPPAAADALPAFREAAAGVLTRRAERAERPIEREQWLPGWLNRVDTYREPNRLF